MLSKSKEHYEIAQRTLNATQADLDQSPYFFFKKYKDIYAVSSVLDEAYEAKKRSECCLVNKKLSSSR